MLKEVQSKYKVRFSDCDPLGHLANSKYLDYMIGARNDQNVEYYNFDILEHSKKTGCVWVVRKNLISYIKETRFNETVTIDTKIIKANEKYIVIEIIMYNEDMTMIHSVLWNYLSYFSLLKRRSEKHSDKLMEYFNNLLVDISHESFDLREKYFRELNKKLRPKNSK